MPFLKREGRVRLYYEVHGNGPLIILSHGYSSDSGMWHGQIEPLTNAGYKILIWSMRGHGRSAYPEDQSAYSEKHTVSDMAALLDEVGGSGCSAIVGGLSLGGYMSQAFYKAYPNRVEALLIIGKQFTARPWPEVIYSRVLDTGPGFKSDKARDGWNKYANETADQFDREGLDPLKHSSPERSQARHRNAEGLAMAARGMLAQRDGNVIANLPNIKVPSLVVVGDKDDPFFAASDYMAKKIPNCQKVVIPNAGHAANIDNPEDFNKAILDFLSSIRASSGHSQKSKL